MSSLGRVRAMLDEAGVAYDVVEHPEELTALDEARASAVSPDEWAKSLAVRLDGAPALAVLPATHRLDLQRLAAVTGARKAELIEEDDLSSLYRDCDMGALPPFGHLYGQRTFVVVSLQQRTRVGLHAGTHTETFVMDYTGFERVAKPVVGRFASERDN
jgi:Ala-tRNA(Pro) deacylase